MATYGRNVFEQIGKSIQVSADGRPEMKIGGVSIDWTTVTAIAGADVTWLDNTVVKIGEKALRYGQVVALITASGLYGPHDPAAADGRQTLALGKCFILNESIRQDETASDHPPVLYGGDVFLGRIIQSGVGAHSLAAGPTLAELLAAFPRLNPVYDT
jgi:hypothetical protein